MFDRFKLTNFAALCAIGAAVSLCVPSRAQTGVYTQHNDLARTGSNVNETILTTANVNASTFGKLFTRSVDGQVYGQPLIVPNLTINGKVRNVLLVATQHDSLYAFDADDPSASTPLWQRSFINPPSVIPVPHQYLTGAPDLQPEVGILSTPVVDPGTKTIYCVTKTLEGDPNQFSSYFQRLHALDLITGNDKVAPATVTATVPGTGDESNGTTVTYNALRENQRPGLVLANGRIYICSASHGDNRPYHGWVLVYNAKTLAFVAGHCDTPNGIMGGIWMSGNAPVVDSDGNVYYISGNGTFTADPSLGNGIDYSDSFVKLDPSANVLDFFTPFNQSELNTSDVDLGSAGPILMPGTDYIVGGGKQGVLYVLNRNLLGKYHPGSDSQVVQSFMACDGEIHCSPVYWNGPTGPSVFLWSAHDALKTFQFQGGQFNTAFKLGRDLSGNVIKNDNGPGGMLSLSANGGADGTGIIWASYPLQDTDNVVSVPGIVRAFNASTMREIWNTEINSTRDSLGQWAKFCCPTIANGKLYMSTFGGVIDVYALTSGAKPQAPTGLAASAGDGQVSLGWIASPNATGYNVKRSTTSGSGYATVRSSVVGTSFTDSGLTNGTTYYYVISAVNNVGESATSAEVSARPAISANSVILNPIADTYVHSGSTAGTNYGASSGLQSSYLSSSDVQQSYLKFDLSAVPSSVTGAKLRLYGMHGAGQGTATERVYLALSNNWGELNTTWNNRPGLTYAGGMLSVGSAQYYEWDVTSLVTSRLNAGASLISLGLKMDPIPSVAAPDIFNSRESSSNVPQLVLTTGAPIINYPNGFSVGSAMQLNGNAKLNGTRIQLTDGGVAEIGTMFYKTPVSITKFHTVFTFQLTNPASDGITFTVQGVGPTAIGEGGGALGYGADPADGSGGIKSSGAVKFDLHDNAGEGPDSTGFFTNAAFPSVPAIDLSTTGIDLHSTHIFSVTIDYSGTSLVVKIRDTSTGATATQSYTANLAQLVGSTKGYVGFTASTGGNTAIQEILSWTFGN